MKSSAEPEAVPTSASQLWSGALFVDFENVYYALRNGSYRLSEDVALAVALDALSLLRQKLREGGTSLVVERSYADWEQMPGSAQRQLQIAGILPRFTDSRRDKNTADIELSLDVLNFVVTRPDLGDIAIVGGDRDYLPILRRLKEHRRRITVAALRDTLSGDVREFLRSYAEAEIVELDGLMTVPQRTVDPRACVAVGDAAVPKKAGGTSLGDEMLAALLRFPHEQRVREVHLGCFLRWLDTQREFNLVSQNERRRLITELAGQGAVAVVERHDGRGHTVSVVEVGWNHPLVQKLNPGARAS